MNRRVLLLSMPYGALDRPALGLSLLKAELTRARIRCDVRYFTFTMAEFLGDDYRRIGSTLPYTAFAGDWTFTGDLYGRDPGRDSRYVEEVLKGAWRLGADDVERVLAARSLAPAFLDYCMEAVDWGRYGLVGFTSTFEQNIASLALARRIKERHPEIVTVFGGANWEGEMGLELHRQFGFVDYACSGEAERSFTALVGHVLSSPPPDRAAVPPGVIHRRSDGTSALSGPAEKVRHMDDLPVPDFSDYFRDLAGSGASSGLAPTLLIETSRGCWWGAHSHCTFCGLNGGSMAFRSKSPRRVLRELRHLVGRWRIDQVEAVDNILDMSYFRTVIPALADLPRPVTLYYEVKANLSREQVQALREAGITRIQPGIESLSDDVLRLMRKGTTGLRNVQLLKWCRQYGVAVDWNVLYGFPGETPANYREQLTLMRSIDFLQPPGACGPIRLDRFSPYHEDPASFGMRDVRPMAPYRFLYPGASDESLARIAYYFDFDYADGDDPRQRVAELIEQVDAWRARGECGTLGARPGGDGSLVLADTRPDAAHPLVTLHGLERAAYEYCDEIRSLPGVVRHLSTLFPDRPPAGSEQVRGFLDSLVANRLMVTDGAGHYLSLAIAPWEPPKRERPPPANRRGRRGTRRKTSARRLRLPMFLGAPAGASV